MSCVHWCFLIENQAILFTNEYLLMQINDNYKIKPITIQENPILFQSYQIHSQLLVDSDFQNIIKYFFCIKLYLNILNTVALIYSHFFFKDGEYRMVKEPWEQLLQNCVSTETAVCHWFYATYTILITFNNTFEHWCWFTWVSCRFTWAY